MLKLTSHGRLLGGKRSAKGRESGLDLGNSARRRTEVNENQGSPDAMDSATSLRRERPDEIRPFDFPSPPSPFSLSESRRGGGPDFAPPLPPRSRRWERAAPSDEQPSHPGFQASANWPSRTALALAGCYPPKLPAVPPSRLRRASVGLRAALQQFAEQAKATYLL